MDHEKFLLLSFQYFTSLSIIVTFYFTFLCAYESPLAYFLFESGVRIYERERERQREGEREKKKERKKERRNIVKC